jgi:hypothetical protein
MLQDARLRRLVRAAQSDFLESIRKKEGDREIRNAAREYTKALANYRVAVLSEMYSAHPQGEPRSA